ncbi:MAG: hypothetical protein LBR15_05910 [Methanobrevibacter sp.]|jgi:hypothetical protein|nr:hypothetical protein [Candidatus Methanovirga australis]
MNYVEGTVKKYVREYSRRLKDGKKKKYQTEQVQIMLSKKDDIFQEEENVVVLSKEVFLKECEKLNSIIKKQKNRIESHKELESSKFDQKEEFEEKFSNLNESYISIQEEYDLLNEKFNLLRKEIKYHKNLNEKLRDLILNLT